VYVVLYHTKLSALLMTRGYHAAGNFCMHGATAVSLFFLLSGFILAYTYNGQIEDRGDHRRFWEARFSRIWPVYVVSLLCASAVERTVPPLTHALATVLMVQAWNTFNLSMAGTWNYVCWTLSVEAFFYLCFPWFQVRLERLSPALQVVFASSMLLVCVLCNLSTHVFASTSYTWLDRIPLPLLRLPEFLAGVASGNYFLGRLSHPELRADGKVLAGNGAWTYLSAIATIALLCTPEGQWTSLVAVSFCTLVFGLAAEKTMLSRVLSTKTMLLGGGISYSIYLMQQPVKELVNLSASRFHVSSEAARMGAMILLLFTVSYLLFKGVEEPVRRLLRSFFAKLEQRRFPHLVEKRTP
jgi:peptidoglycan/LPS O-acetylase OafA/YrhL